MWTPTDHWLEITIETLGRWEGWTARGAPQGHNIYGEISRTSTSASFFLPPQNILNVSFMTMHPRERGRGEGCHLPAASFNKDWGKLVKLI